MIRELVILILAIVLIALLPFVGIWSLNTLFVSLLIPFTWQTWLAYLFIAGTLAKWAKK